MTLTLTPSEQAVYDAALLRRSEKFAKPQWMQPMRATQIKLALRKAIANLPREERGSEKVHYHADRRVVVLDPTTGRWNKTHEAEADGLPICILRGFVERAQIDHPNEVKELGGGPVTCGHCANAKAS